MRKTFLLLVFSLYILSVQAQELNCTFAINHSQIQGTNKQIFETLESSINNFMNRVWTNHVFEGVERIECNFLLTVNTYEDGVFEGNLQIQSRRPVYNSSYNTTMYNFVDDDISFEYIEYDQLDYSDNNFLSNLTSVLAYYAYIIIGFDYDSFSPSGGEPFFEQAEKIVQNANNSGYVGWQGSDSRLRRNRYWLVTNILDSDYEKVREFYYNYHRLGLDVLESDAEKGREVIFQSLMSMKDLYDNKPDPFMHYLVITIETKGSEIVNIFSEASSEQKKQVYDMLKTIDPGNLSKYETLKE